MPVLLQDYCTASISCRTLLVLGSPDSTSLALLSHSRGESGAGAGGGGADHINQTRAARNNFLSLSFVAPFYTKSRPLTIPLRRIPPSIPNAFSSADVQFSRISIIPPHGIEQSDARKMPLGTDRRHMCVSCHTQTLFPRLVLLHQLQTVDAAAYN